MYRKVTVFFTFDVDSTKTEKQITKCIENQIINDTNYYFQNDDNTAQMTGIEVKKTEKSFTYEDAEGEEFWENVAWDEIDLWGIVAGTLREEGKPELIQECIDEVLKVDKLRDKLDIIEKYCDIEVRLTIKESGYDGGGQCECDICKKARGEIIDE